MHVQIINFSLNDLTHDAYSDACNDIAETFANLPGLISKLWIANPETNTYGGVYFWESKKTWKTILNLKCLKKLPTTLLSQTQIPRTLLFWKAQQEQPEELHERAMVFELGSNTLQ